MRFTVKLNNKNWFQLKLIGMKRKIISYIHVLTPHCRFHCVCVFSVFVLNLFISFDARISSKIVELSMHIDHMQKIHLCNCFKPRSIYENESIWLFSTTEFHPMELINRKTVITRPNLLLCDIHKGQIKSYSMRKYQHLSQLTLYGCALFFSVCSHCLFGCCYFFRTHLKNTLNVTYY